MIRHGQTDYNKRGIVQGSGIDASLNDAGRKQAAAFYEAYKHIPFDKIYVSELRRTRESVQLFIDQGIPYEKLSGLNEIGWGVAEGSVFMGDNASPYFDILEKWKAGDLDIKVEGAESPLEVQARQEKALNYILSKKDEKTILICMHGRAIRILLCWIQNQPLSAMDTIPHDNLCLYKINYNGSFQVETFYDIRHLSRVC